jgi:hypothetical protein
LLGIIGTGGGVREGMSLHGFEPGEGLGVGDGDLNGLGDGEVKGDWLGEGIRNDDDGELPGEGEIGDDGENSLGDGRVGEALKSDKKLDGDGADNLPGLIGLGIVLDGDLPRGCEGYCGELTIPYGDNNPVLNWLTGIALGDAGNPATGDGVKVYGEVNTPLDNTVPIVLGGCTSTRVQIFAKSILIGSLPATRVA